MKIVKVYLPTTAKVQTFVETLLQLEGDFELLSGNYILDARSLMGIFSLDLTKALRLKVYNDSQKNLDAISPFIFDGSDEI